MCHKHHQPVFAYSVHSRCCCNSSTDDPQSSHFQCSLTESRRSILSLSTWTPQHPLNETYWKEIKRIHQAPLRRLLLPSTKSEERHEFYLRIRIRTDWRQGRTMMMMFELDFYSKSNQEEQSSPKNNAEARLKSPPGSPRTLSWSICSSFLPFHRRNRRH